jgi:hypothetical protein
MTAHAPSTTPLTLTAPCSTTAGQMLAARATGDRPHGGADDERGDRDVQAHASSARAR